MTFAVASAAPHLPADPGGQIQDDALISLSGWPDVHLAHARETVRLNGTVTNPRLHEALANAVQVVARELAAWRTRQEHELSSDQALLYRRAVYFYAKAELIERYRDFDLTGAGEKRADLLGESADDCRRVWRWAVCDIQEVPRLTVELL